MSARRKAERRDLVRIHVPLLRPAADEPDRPERIPLRCGEAIRRDPVLHHERVEAELIEFERDRFAFMRRPAGVAAAGAWNKASNVTLVCVPS